jgi:hypothetical protein
MATILVQLADPLWTMHALRSACRMARDYQTDVTLLRLIPVQHVGWLGTELVEPHLPGGEYEALRSYLNIAQGFETTLNVQSMQYVSLGDALVDAAHYLDAVAVFAPPPQSKNRLLQKLQTWNFQRRLAVQYHTI